MRVVHRRVVAALLGMGMTVSPAGAAVQGRYLGSLYRTEGTIDENRMLHRYDLTLTNDLPGLLALDLNVYLSHESRPGIADAELLRSRFQANLRKGWWRVQSEFTPWQRGGLSTSSPRQRYAQLGLLLAPARGPQFSATVSRHDRESTAGPSSSRDLQARISHTLFGVSPYLSFQTSHAGSGAGSETGTRHRTWSGGVSGGRSWNGVSAQAAYDFLISSTNAEDLRFENRSHWTSAGANWLLNPKLSFSGNVSARWTKNEDFIGPQANWLDDKAWNVGALYLPFAGLSLQAYRDYRKAEGTARNLVSDFISLRADFRRDVVRRVAFQAGGSKTLDLKRRQSSAPLDQVYTTLDGRLRDGLELRGELRLLGAADESGTNLKWKRLLGIRALPTRKLRLEAAWRQDDLPGFGGVGQTEIGWDFNTNYRPSPSTDVTATYRWQVERGRVESEERYGSLALSRRMGNGTTFSVNGVKRRTQSGSVVSTDGWVSSDLSFWLPREFRVKTTVRWQSPGTERSRTTYGLSVDKNF